MIIKKVSRFFKDHSQAHSSDPEIVLKEYITKMVLVVLAVVCIPFSIISLVGWLLQLVPADTVIISVILVILCVSGWWLANRGKWRVGSMLPPAFLLIIAMYGNTIGGIDAPAMLIYVLAIIMAAVLVGVPNMYLTLAASLLAYLIIGLAHRYGFIDQIRSAETAFTNRIIIVMMVIIGITLVVHFFIIQFKKALLSARQELIERKKVTVALEESEKKYRELVQDANSIILKLNKQGEITFINEFAQTFFGYPSEEIVGRNIVGTILPETDSAGTDLRGLMNEVYRNENLYQTNENENVTRDGRRVWVNWANKPITDEGGELTGFLCVGNDITEITRAREDREKMQNQLLHAQKMDAIGTLASGFAHDFNNILAGIMGSLSLLNIHLKNRPFDGMEKIETYTQIAVDSTNRASQLVNRLLLFCRRQDIKLKPVDLNASIANVVNICKNSLPKNVRIRVRYGEGPMLVMGDPTIMEQILLNFCVNGSQAMTIMRDDPDDDGGILDIVVSQEEHGSELPGASEGMSPAPRQVAVVISDTGVGMDEAVVQRIFEPFYSINKHDTGTGLGLAIAYDFISRLGGGIEVQSQRHVGTSFKIFLPALDVDAAIHAETVEMKKLFLGKGTILVIDDEKAVLRIAEATLNACGYTTLLAGDGPSGLEIYRKQKDLVTAVLLDVSMPYMSGNIVFEKLKEINPRVKVLMSSGNPEDDRVRAALVQGAAGFLQKPYIAEDLSRQINEILTVRR